MVTTELEMVSSHRITTRTLADYQITIVMDPAHTTNTDRIMTDMGLSGIATEQDPVSRKS